MYIHPLKAELEGTSLPCLGEPGGLAQVSSHKRYLGALLAGEAQEPIRQQPQMGTDIIIAASSG